MDLKRWTVYNEETGIIYYVTDKEFKAILDSNLKYKIVGKYIEAKLHTTNTRLVNIQRIWIDLIIEVSKVEIGQ